MNPFGLFAFAMEDTVEMVSPALQMVHNLKTIIHHILTQLKLYCKPHLDGCNSVADCDPNAQCVFSNREQRYQCECGQGFFGDGKICYVLDQGIK